MPSSSLLSSLLTPLENVFAIREKFDIAKQDALRLAVPPSIGIGACKTEARPDADEDDSKLRLRSGCLDDGRGSVGGSNVVQSRRQSDRTSEHDMPRGTGGKGGEGGGG